MFRTMNWVGLVSTISVCSLTACVQVPRVDRPIPVTDYLQTASADVGELNENEVWVAPIGLRLSRGFFMIDVMLEGPAVPLLPEEGTVLQFMMHIDPNDYLEIRYPGGDRVRLLPCPPVPGGSYSGVDNYTVPVGEDRVRVLIQAAAKRPRFSAVPSGRYRVRLLGGAPYKSYSEVPLRMIVDTDWHEFEIVRSLIAPRSRPPDDPLRQASSASD